MSMVSVLEVSRAVELFCGVVDETISTYPSIDPPIVIWCLATGLRSVEATVIDALRRRPLKAEGVEANQAEAMLRAVNSLAGSRRTAPESPPKALAATWSRG